MKELIERSYQSIRKRGLITDNTSDYEFIEKMNEELFEIKYANRIKFEKSMIAEAVDLAAVCINFITHKGYNFEKEFENCVLYQEKRKD